MDCIIHGVTKSQAQLSDLVYDVPDSIWIFFILQ